MRVKRFIPPLRYDRNDYSMQIKSCGFNHEEVSNPL